MFMENQPAKIPSSVRSDIGNMPLLTELGLFGNGETINLPALTGFPLRLGVLALKDVNDPPYRRPSYQA